MIRRADDFGMYPPEIYKQATIWEKGMACNADILIETGTYLGGMIHAQRGLFSEMYSVESGPELYKRAVERFADDSSIHILLGDSREVLRTLLPTIDKAKRIVFFLDSHCPFAYDSTAPAGVSECPVLEELSIIFSECTHYSIVIDDVRVFGKRVGWPTLADVVEALKDAGATWSIERDQLLAEAL